MGDFLLPAGSIVKHGTTSELLEYVVRDGLLPNRGRHTLRSRTEAVPTQSAVYVGGLAAYFGAYASHAAVMKQYSGVEHRLSELGSIASQDPRGLLRESFAAPPLSLPVVLVIELQDQVKMVADEDFCSHLIGARGRQRLGEETDEAIWEKYQSGGLVRPGGIPASWILRCEFPQPLAVDEEEPCLETLTKDCILLAAGVAQIQSRERPGVYEVGDGPWTSASGLSQSFMFSREAVDRFLKTGFFGDKYDRLYSLLTLQYLLQWAATEIHGVGFEY